MTEIHQSTTNVATSQWLRSFVPNRSEYGAGPVAVSSYGQAVTPFQTEPRTRKRKKWFRGNTWSNSLTTAASFQSINYYLRWSYIILAMLILGLGGWAYFFQIQGAVISSGSIEVEGRPKVVQHLNGGVVKQINVVEGERVQIGDVLLELDPTMVDANKSAAKTQFYENEVLISRLLAEKNQQNVILWPASVLENRTESQIAMAMNGQKQLFQARKTAFNGEIDRLQIKLERLREEVLGLSTEMQYTRQEREIVQRDIAKLNHLLRSGLVSQDRLVARSLEESRLDNRLSQLTTQYEAMLLHIRDAEVEIEQLHNTRREEVISELRMAEAQRESLNEILTKASIDTERIHLLAPVMGRVHELKVTTIGEVIAPGQELMKVVPFNEELIVETKIFPQDIDQVFIGQSTSIVFSSLTQKTPPELEGSVTHVSADSHIDEVTGQPYYLVKIKISDDQIHKLNGVVLVPGMPADVFIQTRSQSVMSYILAPITKSLRKSMREG